MPLIFYTTYGYPEDDLWVIPARVWIYERRDLAEKLIVKLAGNIGLSGSGEMTNFQDRIQDFLGDSKSRKAVAVSFVNDPEKNVYRVQKRPGHACRTDKNGLVEGEIIIPDRKARELLSLQGSHDGWLTCMAVTKGHSGMGRIRLIEPTGISLISDIDDTIKITGIPAGPQVVIMNTFFRSFRSVPGMAKMFSQLKGASFHYISGSPWQLYRPLAEFLFSQKEGFPEGTFHMKNARKNPLSPNAWEDLKDLITNENLTFEQKIFQATRIMQRFPKRKFVLVGDSGEKDPEVYREIREKFPGQVLEIRIRDTGGDCVKNPQRFEGMTIIADPPGAYAV